MPDALSALAVVVPEAEALVEAYRDLYDPSAASGMPAHITVLYPFLAPDRIDRGVLERVRASVASIAVFDFALPGARRFPDRVLYLAIEPEAPFRQLTLALWQAFPETPPYGGRYPTLVPHLTIADRRQGLQLDEIGRDFDHASAGNCRSEPASMKWRCSTTDPGAGSGTRVFRSVAGPPLEFSRLRDNALGRN